MNEIINEQLKEELLDKLEQIDDLLFKLSCRLEVEENITHENWQEYEDIISKIYSKLDDVKLDITHT